MDANETDVRAVLDRLYKAWADNDAEAFADLYVEDATVVMPGVFHQGRPAVRDFMAQAFAGPMKGSRAVDEPENVRVYGDTAVIVSKSGIIMAGESEVPAEHEVVATWVLAKRNGEWLISAYANAPAR
ncbi:SgcJ/EcaC family oxidoreductase [Actinomadura napierensis]|uniref:SgcJ/EcaC family oxidoreductase n=1 Tax=Actinomadura napierensis TaxID=267854 RepID=A0ABP5JLI9_9ACTN